MTENLTTDAHQEPVAVRSPRQYYLGVIALAMGMVMSLLDQVIVGTAMPTIIGALGGVSELSWVVTAYLVTTAATTPLWGKLGDLYGRRATYTASITIFAVGSMLSGLSQNMTELISFRALQGLGAGGLLVGAFALIGDLVTTPAERAKLLALIGGIMPAALALGPLLGGFLTQTANWRWVFYINLPLVACALVATALGVPRAARKYNVSIDWVGSGLLTGAIVAIVLAASWAGTRYSWDSAQIIGLAVVAVIFLAALPYVELRVPEAILPPRMFHSRDFNLCQVLGLLMGASMLGVLTYLPQYMQDARGVTPTESGLLLLPFTVGMIGLELISARLMGRTGQARPYPIIGGIVATGGMLLLLVLNTSTNVVFAAGLTLVAGCGVGLTLQATQLVSFSSVAPADIGAASGLVNLFRTIGGSVGIAVLGSVYTSRLTIVLDARLGTAAGSALASSSGRLTPAQFHNLPAPALYAFRAGVTVGLHGILIGGAAVTAAGFVTAWFVRGRLRTARK